MQTTADSPKTTPTPQTLYPARYYAGYDPSAPQPAPVLAWYDTWGMSTTDGLPPAAQLIPVTEQDWQNTTTFRSPAGRGVQDGRIIDYSPPPPPLAQQAQRQLQQAASTTWSLYGMYGESPPAVWQSYLQALRRIATGADTTSTSLPAAPATQDAATDSTPANTASTGTPSLQAQA
ncbi:MAG: hypothetical protein ACTINM_06300 [Acetobacter cibinongensis]